MSYSTRVLFRGGEWPVVAQGDGWLILPRGEDGSLPPANEAGADSVEVSLAEYIVSDAAWAEFEAAWQIVEEE